MTMTGRDDLFDDLVKTARKLMYELKNLHAAVGLTHEQSEGSRTITGARDVLAKAAEIMKTEGGKHG